MFLALGLTRRTIPLNAMYMHAANAAIRNDARILFILNSFISFLYRLTNFAYKAEMNFKNDSRVLWLVDSLRFLDVNKGESVRSCSCLRLSLLFYCFWFDASESSVLRELFRTPCAIDVFETFVACCCPLLMDWRQRVR